MKKKLLLLTSFFVLFSSGLMAQSNDRKKPKFTSEKKKYNDWDVAVFVGAPFLQGADLNTFDSGNFNFGYDVQLVVSKQITSAFALALQGNYGKTEQSARLSVFPVGAETDYYMGSILGDINFSSLLRRPDNKSRYSWSLHGYAGVGLMSYEASTFRVGRNDGEQIGDAVISADTESLLNSFFGQAGAGIRYKLNQKFDIEFKGMLVFTGDEEFDGSSRPGPDGAALFTTPGRPLYTEQVTPFPYDYEEGRDDSFWTASIGVHYKIGKHKEHLAWINPMDELYKKIANLTPKKQEPVVICKKGDNDNDGVCDDWDRQLDTPEGAFVSGSGVAFDTDKDGILDHIDACPTFPGKPSEDVTQNGCPSNRITATGQVIIDLSAIQFYKSKSEWYPEFDSELDKAYQILEKNPDANFVLEGHTDARGSSSYNLRLSQRRADAVKRYFVSKGIASNRIVAVGKGESDLLDLNCGNGSTCTEEQHRVNRRVLLRSDRPLTLD